MQSVDNHTLKEIKRDNISIADYQELQKDLLKMVYLLTRNLYLPCLVIHMKVLQKEFQM